MMVAVVASGDLETDDEQWLDRADRVIAADGGAATLAQVGRRPDRVVGDLDSAPAELVERLVRDGVAVERHPADKDASDTELALASALAAGAAEVVLLGALGGPRLDHALANLLLLSGGALAAHEVSLVHDGSTIRVARAGETLRLRGRIGDIASLLPLGGDAVGVVTDGLRWQLDGDTLPMGSTRGLSNEVVAIPASIRLSSGTLLVVETVAGGEAA